MPVFFWRFIMVKSKVLLSTNFLTLLAVVLGIICGLLQTPEILAAATVVSDVAIKLMKLIALPLLFLSVVSSAAHFSNLEQIKALGVKIFSYTLFTTLIATLVAESLYWIVSPFLMGARVEAVPAMEQRGFFATLVTMIPDNVLGAFLDGNVIAVVVMAILLAVAMLSINKVERDAVFTVFGGLLNAVMRIVRVGLKAIPLSVWAFVTILISKTTDGIESINAIGGLALTVIASNIIQGVIILPMLLRYKGISAKKLFVDVKDALIMAFFTRSSMATLPITLERAIDNAKINSDVARLSLPLCTTINMNGCAQFILLSVYFVSAFSGHPLSPSMHVGMIFLSVIAAIGNAGVPMGCFFLASSILASLDIPLVIMGSILPLYAVIDMVESSLNVWSDVCVTKIIDVQQKKEELVEVVSLHAHENINS